MYTIVTPKQFLRYAGKFFKKHPDLKPRFAKVVSDLQRDPFQPHLEIHPLSGKLSGCHAVSITHSYRITLTLHITEKEIILLDIGAHDEVYGKINSLSLGNGSGNGNSLCPTREIYK